MPNPRDDKYIKRFEQLIEEGTNLNKTISDDYEQEDMLQSATRIALNAWLINAENILQLVFGKNSIHYTAYKEKTQKLKGDLIVQRVIGILAGSLDDIKNGFLIGQEFIAAGELFDSVLEQAKYLNEKGYKDPAAVLCRVVLEDALKKIAKELGILDIEKASAINDKLKEKGRLNQIQWRQIQAWLDIGNAAAHGQFGNYDQGKVQNFIEGITAFLANEFKA